jgi:hypothetical protein
MRRRTPPILCEDVSAVTNQRCTSYARRKPDPDGGRRCYQHSQDPAIVTRRDHERWSGGDLPSLETTRYDSVEALEQVCDDAINALRGLRMKPARVDAILRAVAARQKLAEAKLLALAVGAAAERGDAQALAQLAAARLLGSGEVPALTNGAAHD